MTDLSADEVRNHGLVAKIFHWGFALVFIYALTKQLNNIDELADPALLRFEIVFAVFFLALLVVRFIFMRATHPTALPQNASKSLRRLAGMGHLAMYVSLAMIAISGLMIGAIYSLSGPDGAGMDIALGLHEGAVVATYLTIGLHVLAALFHRLKGDGIWSAMVPVWKEPKS